MLFFRLFLIMILFVFRSEALLTQTIKLNITESEKISSDFISNISPKSISVYGEGNVILNWTKYLGDSTINRKRLILKDGTDNKWYQANIPLPEKELILESRFDSKGNIHMLIGSLNENLISGKSTNFSRLSYFSFIDNKWSNPEIVFDKECKNLTDGFNKAKLFIDKDDQPVILVVNSVGSTYNQKLILFRKRSESWIQISELTNLPYCFSFFIDKTNTYHPGFIKFICSNPDSNGIDYCCSRDEGNSF